MAIRRKKEGEYHTGRLNISCNRAQKDAIAASATEQGKSISSLIRRVKLSFISQISIFSKLMANTPFLA